MEERRKSNRIELKSTIRIKRLSGKQNKEEDISIVIQDVSKTGVGFACKEALAIGEVYESHLRIWTQEVLHAFLEIVRIEKVGSSYLYGSIFIGMPEMDAARIQVYDTVQNMNAEKKMKS